jgi:hypothetical protein
MIDFQGAKTGWDTDFLLIREIDDRFGVIGPIGGSGRLSITYSPKALVGAVDPPEGLSDGPWLTGL